MKRCVSGIGLPAYPNSPMPPAGAGIRPRSARPFYCSASGVAVSFFLNSDTIPAKRADTRKKSSLKMPIKIQAKSLNTLVRRKPMKSPSSFAIAVDVWVLIKASPHLGKKQQKKKSMELQYLIFEKSNKDENEKKS